MRLAHPIVLMGVFRGLSVAILLFTAVPAVAQPWKQAYETGDIFRALDILQPLVFERDRVQDDRDLDPEAASYLATYFVNGWRVKRDLVVACGLTLAARRAADLQRRYPGPLERALAALDAKTCRTITQEQRLDATVVAQCPNIGLASQQVDFGDGVRVDIWHRKVIVHQPARMSEGELGMPCAQYVLPARARTLGPTAGAPGHRRRLLELFAWSSGVVKGQRRRQLVWMMWEVVDGGLERSARETVADEPGSAWPERPVPERVRVDFRVTNAGEVEYSVTTAAGERRRGTLRPYDDIVKSASRRGR